MAKDQDPIRVEKCIKTLNVVLAALIGFTVVYSIFFLIFVKQKNGSSSSQPIVLVNSDSDNPHSSVKVYTNSPSFQQTNVNTNIPEWSKYEQKEEYEPGQIVVINLLNYKTAIINKKISKEYYEVVYEDHDKMLRTMVLHRKLLYVPGK